MIELFPGGDLLEILPPVMQVMLLLLLRGMPTSDATTPTGLRCNDHVAIPARMPFPDTRPGASQPPHRRLAGPGCFNGRRHAVNYFCPELEPVPPEPDVPEPPDEEPDDPEEPMPEELELPGDPLAPEL